MIPNHKLHELVEGLSVAAAPSIGASWVTPEIGESRRQAARDFCEARNGVWQAYRGGLEEMAERGRVTLQPQGDRVLTVAILAQDASDGALQQPVYNSREAIIHKVVAMGSGVATWYDRHAVPVAERIKPGDYVSILATVADNVSATDRSCRYWTTRIEHIGCRVDVVR